MTEMKNPRPTGRGNSEHPERIATRYGDPYAGRVRARNPETSWNVARIPARDLSELQSSILSLLAETPMHDDALVRAYAAAGHPRRSPQRISTARAELVYRGLVVATDRSALSDYGNPSTVWEVVL